ncbi:protein kinase [Nostoc sp. CENA67]|uniref:non-specific serine/threonine protein kinase n=1 Tax=Amazonocrinis nigriterrae CENA67 TaxID=2794033 RepID=A0A8J7HR63_9NOST|nr:bifunctional serine/threonine-protein kinase/ABC transporter substrate-binding protein [Amazonocrinis nigriterrae]MBH8562545.1 protein kinase [Amazonocrinis nigriterrae CENA67]
MDNNGSSIEVYCTRPNCNSPHNFIPEESLTSSSKTEIRCSCCGMPLILEGRFVPLRLLVPDEERGGFGRTFLAEDINFPHRPLRVIKQLHPRNPPGRVLSASELQRIEKLFEDEASILAELGHEQIPRAWAFFVVEVQEETGSLQRFFYLVQDYIEGQNLAQELRQRRQFSEDEVVNILQEILKILQYIHNYDGNRIVIHRDIKPSNIMRRTRDSKLYLIDFGTVKQVVIEGLPANESTILGTPDFAPPEQFAGKRVSAASDLYSLAATCVCLLTGGGNPRELLLNSNWRQHTNVSNERFANVLDSMLKYRQEERPQSAKEVLDALAGETQPSTVLDNLLHRLKRIPRRWRWRISLVSLALLALAIAVIVHIPPEPIPPIAATNPPPPTSTPTPPPPFADYFSRGEEPLIKQKPETYAITECTEAYALKQKGIDAFKAASDSASSDGFQEAEKYFKQATDKFKVAFQRSPANNKCEVDPETWIYYYNSKAAKTTSITSLPTIAVVVPSLDKYGDIALEILRGVTQVMQQNQAAPLFQVLLAKENTDNKDEVKKIANLLADENQNIPGELVYFYNSKILGVIGHITSDNTWNAGNIYEIKKLVLISPTSTALREGNSQTGKLSEYVFRTSSNDFIAARDLANYIVNKLTQRKVLIVFESNSEYSKSLKGEFANTLRYSPNANQNDIQVNCDLSTENKEACIKKAQDAKVQALMLAPSRSKLEAALEIVKLVKQNPELANQQPSLLLLGGDVLYSRKTLETLGNAANGMIVAVSSHASRANKDFIKEAKELWWTTNVSWRTLSSYDAAQAFVKALTDFPKQENISSSRQLVYERLKNISASGATEVSVKFDKNHDRKIVTGVGVLVQAQYSSNPNRDEYGFIHLNTPQRNNQDNP